MFTSHLLFQQAETALLGEKANKLFGIARYLDLCLDDTLDHIKGHPRDRAIPVLYDLLAPVVDRVCEGFEGLGAGYYSRDMDCIIVYGPTRLYKDKTGISVKPDHIGRRCMETCRPVTSVGSMIRGEIMNSVVPIIRNGTVEGFIWANETVEDIYQQMARGGMNIFLSPKIEPLLGLSGLLILGCRTLLSVDQTIVTFERYIRYFLNSLQLSLIVADEIGTIRFVSKKFESMGISGDHYIGFPAEKVFAALGLDGWKHMLKRLRKSGGTYQFETASVGLQGMDMNVVMASLIDEQDHLMGFVTIFQDLAAAQLEQEQIYRAEAVESVEHLAFTMIHEIQNPLTILREAIRMVPRRLENKQYLLKFVEVALAEINHVERVTKTLSEFTRYSLPEFLEFDIVEMVEKAVNLVRGMAEEHHVTVVEYYEPSKSFIYGDPEHLHKAILNLLLNSLQAMPGGGTLSISINEGTDNKLVYIQIKDTGQGIKPELENAVFKPFFTTKAKGTGLGLALVQSIISRHNGILSLEPGFGSGAVFTIGLPKQRILRENQKGDSIDG